MDLFVWISCFVCLFGCLSVCLFVLLRYQGLSDMSLLPTVPPSWPFGGAGAALFLAEALSGRPDLGHGVCSCCGACQTKCLARGMGVQQRARLLVLGQGSQYGRPRAIATIR